MGCNVRLGGIEEESIVDGPGLRFVVFLQGCPHQCKGCHNPETHDFSGGNEDDTDAILARFGENPLLAGMTLSGGEPFAQPEAALALAEGVKAKGKNLVIFTGYLCEELAVKATKDEAVKKLLALADMLVDGPYMEELRDLTLLYRGSSNQRVLTGEEIRQACSRSADSA
ncbi:anaerobic ribonucleoside-triphosphate reductase activating protein [Desulfovibrio sp. OttesenSCG-928-G15]|nr:anaerobic ribonucleoside-triphosphate reductase activating protein [Desulfovibrio sp. OttesenSCG-928-G15]